jgi:hypothetical protein
MNRRKSVSDTADLGGITAWVAAGYPVERELLDAARPTASVAATVPAK